MRAARIGRACLAAPRLLAQPSTRHAQEVQEGDVLNLAVKIERKHLAEDKDWIDSDDEDDEPDETTFDKQLEQFEEGSEEWEQRKDELMEEWRDAYFERQKKKRIREKTRNPQSGELGFAAKPLRDSVAAHAPHFPFERAEQWMVLLVDSKAPDRDLPRSRPREISRRDAPELGASSSRRGRREIASPRLAAHAPRRRLQANKLVGYQKLTQNSRYEKVQLKFLAPKEGMVHYEIHAMCSAYLGADKKVRCPPRCASAGCDLGASRI